MRALFVFLYLPVLFSATNSPKFSLQSTNDAWRGAETAAWPNSVLLTKSHDPLRQSIHYLVERPYIEPYRICLSEYSFGASQASSLVNQPLLNWNKLNGCHPLESVASFVHPIPFVSTLLLILSVITSWVILNIIILNGVWYICWHCVKEINPLRLPIKEAIHVESTSSNGTLSLLCVSMFYVEGFITIISLFVQK